MFPLKALKSAMWALWFTFTRTARRSKSSSRRLTARQLRSPWRQSPSGWSPVTDVGRFTEILTHSTRTCSSPPEPAPYPCETQLPQTNRS